MNCDKHNMHLEKRWVNFMLTFKHEKYVTLKKL